MKTKTVKKAKKVVKEVLTDEKVLIGRYEDDLGRGDLNALRDKLNEVIDKLNGN